MNIFWTRIGRIFNKDVYLPSRCYAEFYKVSKNDICDCKVWCKYPPPGRPVYVHENSTLSYKIILVASNKNGNCKATKGSPRNLRKE